MIDQRGEAVEDAGVIERLDALLDKVGRIEARLGALESAGMGELAAPVALALSGMTDDMLVGLVARVSRLAEVALDPGVVEALSGAARPEVLDTLTRVTAPSTLEALRGLAAVLELLQSAMTDEMVVGLVRKVATLAELALDPFLLDALVRLARALKAGQAEYPDVKVPPVGGAFGALRSANDPDTRRVAAFALAVMRNLGQDFS